MQQKAKVPIKTKDSLTTSNKVDQVQRLFVEGLPVFGNKYPSRSELRQPI